MTDLCQLSAIPVYDLGNMSKEIQRIIDQIDSQSLDSPAILATVVDLLGSGYRLPGAKMLITENGEAFGTVSGGCLESDVLERAQKVLNTGEAEILTYDTTGNEESVFSLNMGCNGVVRILIEPFKADSILVRSWKIAVEQRLRRTVATIISSNKNLNVGGRFFYCPADQFTFENVPKFSKDSEKIKSACVEFFESDKSSKTEKFADFEIFFESVDPPLNLVIFGAGYDAIPLANFAKELGWRVCVVDHREAFASKDRFPNIDEITISHPENLGEKLKFDSHSVAVLMTHNYQKDREIMKFLLGKELKYIGALGPKRRTERIFEELEIAQSDHKNVFAPIGLDIGADTPESIALSIIAEIKCVLRERNGGFLRDRDGSIYGRN